MSERKGTGTKTAGMHCNQVWDRIYCACAVDALDCGLVKSLGITAIVCVATEHHPERVHTIPVYRVGLHDEMPDRRENSDATIREAVEALAWLHRKPEERIMVHCTAGHNRSVSVIAAYLASTGLCPNVDAAYAAIHARHETRPQPKLIAHMKRLFD